MNQSPPIQLHEDFSFTDAELEDKFNQELVAYIKENQQAFAQAVSSEDMSPNPNDAKILALDKKLTYADAKEQIRSLKRANQALKDSQI